MGTKATAIEMHITQTGQSLVQREVELTEPASGEVRVAIEAVGVAYADIAIRLGTYPGVKPPVTPGYDLVGRIEALGPEVNRFQVGQQVAAVPVTGCYATQRNVDAVRLVPAPEGTDAALLVAAS